MSLKKLLARMQILQKTNRAEKAMASSMLAVTNERIFRDGKDSKGASLGNYSLPYLKQRIKQGYPASRKIILQATGQMAQDFSVITGNKTVGLGFKNTGENGPLDKSEWVEDTYNTKIFAHTEQEKELANKLFSEEVNKILNG